jgi:hypothetical protein
MQTITGYYQMAHAAEMTRFWCPSDLADFPRERRYIYLKFNKSSCADVPCHAQNLPNQRGEINAS